LVLIGGSSRAAKILEVAINLKVAKALGITVPREVLYQADLILR